MSDAAGEKHGICIPVYRKDRGELNCKDPRADRARQIQQTAVPKGKKAKHLWTVICIRLDL